MKHHFWINERQKWRLARGMTYDSVELGMLDAITHLIALTEHMPARTCLSIKLVIHCNS